MIIWLTGQPGSGKTTLCKQMMLNMGSDVFHIDGDDLKQISEYLHNKGKHVFVSLVSPYKNQRDKFKSKMGDNLIEVYVHTTEVRGREQFFVEDYQQPSENYIDIDTTNVSNDESKNIDDSANMILEFIKTNQK
jgi:adenylylsulfate kinase-like enzyme